MDIDDELDEIISGAGVSSYSIIAHKIFLSALASLIISVIGAGPYGIIESIRRGSKIFIRLLSGVYSSLKRTVPRNDKDSDKTTLIITGFLISTAQITLFSFILLHFQDFIFDYTFLDSNDKYILKLGIIYLFISSFVVYSGECMKAYKEIPSSNLLTRWINPILQIIFVSIFSLFFANTINNVFYALVSAFTVSFIISIYILFRNTSFSRNGISTSIKIIIPFITFYIFTTLGAIFTTIQYAAPNIGMFTISEVEAGAFGVSLILSSFTRVPLTSINQIFPQVATQLYENDNVEKINLLFKSTSKIAVFFMTIPLILFSTYHSEVISLLFSQQYVQYSPILPMILFGQMVAVSIGTVGFLILMTDNEKQNIVLQIGISVISSIILIFLTIEYSIFGLAFGFAFALSFNNFVELLFLYYKEDLWSFTSDHGKIILLFISTIIILYLIKYIFPIYVNLPISLFLILSVKYIIYNYILRPVEKRAINRYIKSRTTKISDIVF